MELYQIPENKIIMQHNMITSGRYDFSACQLDILFMLLACLEKGDDQDKEYDISVHDVEAITGRKWNYQQLREASRDIGSRMFEIETAEEYIQLWLFKRFKYHLGKGYFTVAINDMAKPYFFELKNNFTRMQLKAVLSCSSKYAKRLYALACQWRTVGIVTMTISELKEMLSLKDSKGKVKEQFIQLSDLKTKVLDIAKKQINEHTDIQFDYELKKRGRSYEFIIIYIDFKKEKQITIDFNESIEFQKAVRTITAYGVSENIAKLIAYKNYDDFLKLIQQMKNGKTAINDPSAYIVGIFQKKGIIPMKS
ncbi:MAG: RepB family plasmid replication initiator protein [Sphingobacteriaceae bacterium]|nr:MAG: RepB family plasmid replication initiator protein [Sphingobacteriaceae bacterium]